MKKLSKLYCWLFKHDMVAEGVIDNGQSKWGAYKCLRCNRTHSWQNDYR